MVKFVKLNPNAHIPTKGSKMAAGYDLYACIPNKKTVCIYTALFGEKTPQHKPHTIRRYILYIITEKAILYTIYSSYCYA